MRATGTDADDHESFLNERLLAREPVVMDLNALSLEDLEAMIEREALQNWQREPGENTLALAPSTRPSHPMFGRTEHLVNAMTSRRRNTVMTG